MNWKFHLMIVYPNPQVVSQLLANRDANTTGSDDRAAQFLHYASVAIQAIINDQPLPTMPTTLATQLAPKE